MEHISLERLLEVARAAVKHSGDFDEKYVFSGSESEHLQECSGCIEGFSNIVREIIRNRALVSGETA